MRIRNNNQLDLEGNAGEQITVQITANVTAFVVASDLDGKASNFNNMQNPFTLKKSLNPSVLVLFFTFTANNGCSYDIKVSGSNGGVSTYTVAQIFNEPDNAIAFTFNVV